MTQTLRRTAPPRTRRLGISLLVTALMLGTATVATLNWLHSDSRRHYLSTDGWPSRGQGAYRLTGQTPAASPHQQPVPIASVAKVMTAYLVLRDYPLGSGPGELTITVTAADVADTRVRRGLDQSLVDVAVGERLTERQALLALLLPSANNMAVMLARADAGSVARFVAKMNHAADELGMHDTTYTDPSGFEATTVSTAADQLVLATAAAGVPALAELMATRSARLPVAGVVHNTDTLLGTGGFLGMKTGSEDAAGGCFMFRVRRVVDGRPVELIGVVLGQWGHHLIDAALDAARQLADRVLQ